MEKKQPFKALSRICLNNWHYIDKKILTFSEGINFFTGHSGSGKSTVIDAMQIVLYANTDGRGFFNKAASDDSDRSLIEYLRGMVNISDNNESQYLRNQNFSSTIVLELTETDTREKQCVGVVFDVETSTNTIGRLFFWHRGGLLENGYRGDARCLTTGEVREYLHRNFRPDSYYCGPSNERFRRQLYDIYLGGLDIEKFPRLFRRAIPFRMNIRLEDFVKEYICTEKKIEIEDMQESVMQYGRMRDKIEETMEEIRELEKIKKQYDAFQEAYKEEKRALYCAGKLEIEELRQKIREYQDKNASCEEEAEKLRQQKSRMDQEIEEIAGQVEDVVKRIAGTGYDALKKEEESLDEMLGRLYAGKEQWERTIHALKEWKDFERTPDAIRRGILCLEKGEDTKQQILELKERFAVFKEELEGERQDLSARMREYRQNLEKVHEDLLQIRQGKKMYPRELEEARYEIRNELLKRTGKIIPVRILADLISVKDERWNNAIEGYLGNTKQLIVVPPEYIKDAMEIYGKMDQKRYCRISVLDTGKILGEEHPIRKGSLAEETKAEENYVQQYLNFLLGNVMKCESIEELKACRIGITPDCMVYQRYCLGRIHPDQYTKKAYIGEGSLKKRRKELEQMRMELEEQQIPLSQELKTISEAIKNPELERPLEEYLSMIRDIHGINEKEERKKALQEQMRQLKEQNLSGMEEEKRRLQEEEARKKEQEKTVEKAIWAKEESMRKYQEMLLSLHAELLEKENTLSKSKDGEEAYAQFMSGRTSTNYEYLKSQCCREISGIQRKKEEEYTALIDVRSAYIRRYPNRTFSTGDRENTDYDQLLDKLRCGNLEEYETLANEQARMAIMHFKEDFVYKIRSAIKEAYQNQEELNRIISKLDFGKDKYRFVITKNKGADGRFYDMFMSDTLDINPMKLSDTMEHQMDLFTMEHEEEYGDLMNELISIFIPPEHATREELEEARRNMEKYADYRTYLSFDMQQIVKGEKIGLGKMIRKNSGGEGQNPLYIALLASFAQIYRVNVKTKVRRPSTLRLVVLDEAFSKMDAEKVASCIALIRGLGFQAIISATNDKIQNYLENVDKTFVYANPDKKHISIQGFEKVEFGQLKTENRIE